jgi:hypothetical protein
MRTVSPGPGQTDTGAEVKGMEGYGWRKMRRYVDRDVLLRAMGLEQRSPAGDFFTGMGLFSVGVLVGAGLGLMFAPTAGDQMRQRMGERWRNRRAGGQDDQRDLGADAGGLPPMAQGTTGTTTTGPGATVGAH